MIMNKDILLIEGVHPNAQEHFKSQGFNVVLEQSAITQEEILKKYKVSAIGIRSRTQIQSEFLSQSKNLLCVGAFCIGLDQVDLKSATQNGVAVFNSPYSNTRSVAELVIANIVNLCRQVVFFDKLAHQQQWKKTARNSFEVRGKTVGIIGYGHVGSQVSILAEAIGLKVLYYDINKKLSLGNAKPIDSLEELLSLSDFVTLHVPRTPKTENMITQKELQMMKKGSYLINTSRGSTVHLKDLYKALKEKHLFGAAIDVFPEEPKSNKEVFKNDLQNLDNVILTPHIGGSTEEAQLSIAKDVSLRMSGFLLRGDSSGSVNFPNLSPIPLSSSCVRIVNVHKNVPGILMQISEIISSLGVNISYQNLETNEDVGYLVTDIETKTPNLDIVNNIQKIEASIKTRTIYLKQQSE